MQLNIVYPKAADHIILADAIFKTPWFKAIENMGWYWVCRVRGNVQLSIDGENWQRSSDWFASANSKAASLGEIYFSKITKHPCNCQHFTKVEKRPNKEKITRWKISMQYG